jgi:hypothetical protein
MQRKKIREFWRSYLQGGDLTYDYQKFVHLTLTGQLLHYEVNGFNGLVLGRFGLQISGDARGAYVTLVYLEAQFLSEFVSQVISIIYHLANLIVPQWVEPRAKVQGRKGWPRYLRRAGLKIDKDHFVSGWQEYFGYGVVENAVVGAEQGFPTTPQFNPGAMQPFDLFGRAQSGGTRRSRWRKAAAGFSGAATAGRGAARAWRAKQPVEPAGVAVEDWRS